MGQIVEPQVLKLAIMAVEAHILDMPDETSAEEIFSDHVHHDD